MVWFRSNQDIAEVILWVTIGGYTAWGIGHHLVRKDLTTMIVIEYFLSWNNCWICNSGFVICLMVLIGLPNMHQQL